MLRSDNKCKIYKLGRYTQEALEQINSKVQTLQDSHPSAPFDDEDYIVYSWPEAFMGVGDDIYGIPLNSCINLMYCPYDNGFFLSQRDEHGIYGYDDAYRTYRWDYCPLTLENALIKGAWLNRCLQKISKEAHANMIIFF